jgi:subtilase family serine protease
MIGNEIPKLLNNLYEIPSHPDLSLEEGEARIRGKYLDLNVTIKNRGLVASQKAELKIYVDEEEIKVIDIEPLKVGKGIKFSTKNTWISKISIDKIKIIISSDMEEINKDNNELLLTVKK